MMKKLITSVSVAALLGSLTVGTVFSFNDLDSANKDAIMDLKNRGIVSGIDGQHFAPQAAVSYAQSIQMIVKGLNLNIDHMRFIKEPLASDYYTNIPNDAWYAQAFIIAHLNGLPIPKDVDPNGSMTREQFADILMHALDKKGSYPLVKMLVIFKDEDQVDPNLSYSLQRIVLHRIATLGTEGKFYPKQEITRGEAAVWVNNTIRFVESHAERPINPAPQEEVTLTVEKVNDAVNKVVLSRGQKPSTGYGITIDSIHFEQDGRAVISYTVSDPLPGSMNATVITEPKAETYVSSEYKAVAERSGISSSGSQSSASNLISQ